MFKRRDRAAIAIATEGVFRGLGEDEAAYPGSIEALIAAGADLGAVAKRLAGAPVLDPSTLDFMPPLARPGKILCVGLNYRDHAAETEAGVPAAPEIFVRFPSTLVAHNAAIVLPALSEQLDYEGELVAVIGKGGRAIARKDALQHVVAYSVFNDASVRDYQFRTRQWTMGKNFDRTGAFGPWLVTADELPAGAAGLRLTTFLNGALVQEASTADLIFDVASLIEFISAAMTLEAGDLIVTGTPAGVGFARKPPLWMRAGDRVEVEIERIGRLSNPVAAQ